MDRPDEPRTNDIYEQIAEYPKPPVIALPDLADLSLFDKFSIRDNAFTRGIIRGGSSASGFQKFVEQLTDDELEALLRKYNLRLPGLFAPTLSATAALADDPRNPTPFERAATLVFGAYSLYHFVFCGELEPDRLNDQPLEMGQYPNLFSTSLVIQGHMPRLFKSVFEPQITVMIGGRFYILQLGELKTETWVEGLANALVRLAQSAKPLKAGELSPGSFSAANSPTQIQLFNRMAADPAIAPNLRLLRRSLLTVCLDLDQQPVSPAEAARLAHSANFENRWFHSSLQLIVFGNGSACTNMSFTAYLDGNTMMRGAAEIQQRAVVYPLNPGTAPSPETEIPIQELAWDFDPKTLPGKLIERSRADIEGVLDPQPSTFELPGYGRKFFEGQKFRPVPTFILALQAAASQLAGRMVTIDQFVNLSAYRCMDVTTAIVSTPEVRKFAETLNNDGDAAPLFEPAIDAQRSIVRKARAQMPPEMLMQLYARSSQGLQRITGQVVLGVSLASLAVFGQMNINPMRDVLVSHPEIHPQVLVVGRPGVRLPYVKSFGLHYQIWPEKTVLTYMPGLKWKPSNQEITAAIEANLAKIAQLKP